MSGSRKPSTCDEVAAARFLKRHSELRQALAGMADSYRKSRRRSDATADLGQIAICLAGLRPELSNNVLTKAKTAKLSTLASKHLARIERQAARMPDCRYKWHAQYARPWGQLVLDVEVAYPGAVERFLRAARLLELPCPASTRYE